MAGFRRMIHVGTKSGMNLWSSLQPSKSTNYSSSSSLLSNRFQPRRSSMNACGSMPPSCVQGNRFDIRNFSNLVIPNGNRAVVVKKSVMISFLEKQGLSSKSARATTSSFAEYLNNCSKNICSDGQKQEKKTEELQQMGQKHWDELRNLIADDSKKAIAAQRDDFREAVADLRVPDHLRCWTILTDDQAQTDDPKKANALAEDDVRAADENGASAERTTSKWKKISVLDLLFKFIYYILIFGLFLHLVLIPFEL